jgi:hypothetical protein
VLGQHLGRDEDPVLAQLALRHDALPLAEQVRQHAAIGDAHLARGVGDGEADLTIGAARDAAVDHEPAKAEAAAPVDLAARDIAGRDEEGDVVAQRGQGQRRGTADQPQHDDDQGQTLLLAKAHGRSASPQAELRAPSPAIAASSATSRGARRGRVSRSRSRSAASSRSRCRASRRLCSQRPRRIAIVRPNDAQT